MIFMKRLNQSPICAGVIALAAAILGHAPAAAQEAGYAGKNVALLGISSGTVAPSGLAFAAISATSDLDGTDTRGGLAFGLGFGNADDGVGVQIATYFTDIQDGVGESGFFELKASKQLSAGPTRIYGAVSVRGGGFGADSNRPTSGRLAISGFQTFEAGASQDTYPVMWTLGVGTHERNNNTDPGIFGGVGIGLTPNIGASLAWEGEYFTLGTSFRFNNLENLRVTASVLDVFDQENSRSLNVSVSYFFRDLF